LSQKQSKKSKSALVQDFCNYLQFNKGLSDNTIKAYKSDILKFLQFLEGDEISNESLKKYVTLLSNENQSENSKVRKISSINQYVQWSNSVNLSKQINIEKISLKTGSYLPETLAVSDIIKMIDSYDFDNFLNARNKAIIDFMYSTACRVSELTDVKISDIDFDDNFVKLQGKGSKQRIVPIGSELNETLQSYLKIRKEFENNESYLFISKNKKKLDRSAVFRLIKKTALTVGINSSVHPHTLRHSAATHMLEAGCDLRTLQEFLGHTSVSTTKIYTKLTKEFLVEIFKESHPRA
jgi:integrase/recombinase XerD